MGYVIQLIRHYVKISAFNSYFYNVEQKDVILEIMDKLCVHFTNSYIDILGINVRDTIYCYVTLIHRSPTFVIQRAKMIQSLYFSITK